MLGRGELSLPFRYAYGGLLAEHDKSCAVFMPASTAVRRSLFWLTWQTYLFAVFLYSHRT